MLQHWSGKEIFYGAIKHRSSLCGKGSEKETLHIELDLSRSGIEYQVGDSLAIYPENDPREMAYLVALCGGNPNILVEDPRLGDTVPFGDYLLKRANLGDCTKKFLERVTEGCKSSPIHALLAGDREHLKQYQVEHTVADVLAIHPEVRFSPEELLSFLKPMMPRFYSIASSMRAVGEEAHLTVSVQKWYVNGREKWGVCTHYLNHLVPLNVPIVPMYLHRSQDFTLPEDSGAPVIMVGPGTGVAPYRGFMQERESIGASGKNWLFFGEWHRQQHYFYEEYWSALVEKGLLRVNAAFSRDQEVKHYVQHQLVEHGAEVFRWLEEGGYFFVCGDAKRMAKSVETALKDVIQTHGAMDAAAASDYVKKLRQEKRYRRDVY